MSLAREDVLVMIRALKRGWVDARGIHKALERQVRKPVSFLEALHLPAEQGEALRTDGSVPDPVADRAVLDQLRTALLSSGEESPGDWEKFVASLTRPPQRTGHAALPVPQEFDGLTLKWELARRERGVLYRAVDAAGREVAVKVFRSEAAGLPKVNGLSYAAAPFEEGDSLEAKRPSAKRGAEAVRKAADLLRGRPHGALSPARILLRKDDSVVVVAYEWAKALPLSARTRTYSDGDDVRALGAVLYELLVGVPPADEVSPRERVKDVDPALDQVTACALGGGYADTGAFADDLGRVLKGESPTGRRAVKAAAAGASPRRKAPLLWAAAALLPLAGAAVWFLTRSESKPATPPPSVVKTPVAPPRETPSPAPAPKAEARVNPVAPPPVPLGPGEDEALYKACLSAIERGDRARILLVAGEAASRGSVREWSHYHLASVFLAQGELDQALRRVTRALELAPESRDALELRAQTHALRADVKRATEDLEQLHGKKASELNQEIQQLGRQIQAAPQDASARLLRGVYFQLKRHYENAALDFTAAIDGGQRRALLWRAHAFRGAEDRGRALTDVRLFLQEFPQGPAAQEARELLKELGS